MDLYGNLTIKLIETSVSTTKINIQIQYALNKYDSYRQLNSKESQGKKITQHKVAYFNQGEVATFPPERFEPDKELSVEQYLLENENSNIDIAKFSDLANANIYYSPPQSLMGTYPKNSTSMYCVANTIIEESIVKILNSHYEAITH